MTTTGVDLIRRMATGDQVAFTRFYDLYASLVFPLIVHIVRERAEATHVLREVFWEAWRRASKYDAARGSPEAWLVARARSRALERIRARRKRGETLVGSADDPSATAPGAEEPGVQHGALDRLPETQREVLELAYYGGLTQTEISERFKQPLGTVRTRIRLALARLREVAQAT
jgi:RNA polymerase sigma-70 factor (ECF subfamily)